MQLISQVTEVLSSTPASAKWYRYTSQPVTFEFPLQCSLISCVM